MTQTAGDTDMTTGNDNHNGSFIEYVTVMIGGQLFGLPISKVQDVFMLDRLARVPLASAEIAGVLNLRGRIVTAIDMHCRLGLGQRQTDRAAMAVGIEYRSESYGLLIDSVGEVLKLAESGREPNPVNLDPHLARVSAGVHRLDKQLLVVLDVDRIFEGGNESLAARTTKKLAIWWSGGTRPFNRGRSAMKTCLVVDDSSVIRKVARRILEGLEFEISEAEDGEEALAACQRQLPDAVLLDWNMPKMDGYEFLRALRRLPGGDGPKVVFCTTENDVAHIARALHAGANEYIMKPFDKDIVEAKFQEVGLL